MTDTFDGHGMGLTPNPPDARDWLFEQIAGAAILPVTVNLNANAARIPIWSQQSLPSCVAFGTDRGFAQARRRQRLPYVPPSQLHTYYWTRFVMGGLEATTKATGCYIRAGAKAVQDYGVPPDSVWPYVLANFDDPPSAPVETWALLNQATEYYAIPNGAVDLIDQALAERYVVIFGMPLHDNFRPDASGMVPLPAGNIAGYHCMALTGYDKQSVSRPWYWVDNSWSHRWGGVTHRDGSRTDGGRCKIRREHIRAYGFDATVIRVVESGA